MREQVVVGVGEALCYWLENCFDLKLNIEWYVMCEIKCVILKLCE